MKTLHSTHLNDGLAPGPVPLALVLLLLPLEQETLARRAILERELGEQASELLHARLARAARSRSEVDAGEVEAVDEAAMHHAQGDDALRRGEQKLADALAEVGLRLVLGDDLEVVPRRLAAPLHRSQTLLHLVEVGLPHTHAQGFSTPAVHHHRM